MLAVKDLTVWRGDNLLLDNISFSLEPGEVMQVQGANGSGKTTLLRTVCGVGIADEGDVYWHGVPIRRSRDQFNEALLYLGHKAGIKGGLTARENLRIFSTLAGQTSVGSAKYTGSGNSGNSADHNIESALSDLSLLAKADIGCRHLSAGQQRRVSLARLLLQTAKLWVLDEPLTSLDAAGLAWVEKQIDRHATNGGAVLLTTHAPLNIDSVRVDTLALG